ncbi:hypothetical protein FJ567_05030 [Mesorhizobium sp. B2-4-16]|nr:hypothetical protein FJ567_05030 [Mesorhizobium sp. B2-4-16]TPL76261.1 hypothetical protein FJ956_04035 [Mesorhizobium sp. B2-4-3]
MDDGAAVAAVAALGAADKRSRSHRGDGTIVGKGGISTGVAVLTVRIAESVGAAVASRPIIVDHHLRMGGTTINGEPGQSRRAEQQSKTTSENCGAPGTQVAGFGRRPDWPTERSPMICNAQCALRAPIPKQRHVPTPS